MHKALIFLALVVAALAQDIRQGSSGPDVVAIQFLLRHRGQSNIVTDGQFNPATRDAVIAFQRSASLTADGVVNSNTIAALGPVLSSGAEGEAVRAAQYLLRTKYGAGISVNGQFNAITENAVRDFQRARGLEVTGMVGRNTWIRLFRGGSAASPSIPSCSDLGPSTRFSAYREGRSIGTIETVMLQGRRVERQTACAFLEMASAARSSGLNLQIVAGFRTWDEQERLYQCFRTRSCSSSAGSSTPPGFQVHQNGISLDFNIGGGVYAWLAANAQRFGFVRTIPSENWHWEYRPGTPRASFT